MLKEIVKANRMLKAKGVSKEELARNIGSLLGRLSGLRDDIDDINDHLNSALKECNKSDKFIKSKDLDKVCDLALDVRSSLVESNDDNIKTSKEVIGLCLGVIEDNDLVHRQIKRHLVTLRDIYKKWYGYTHNEEIKFNTNKGIKTDAGSAFGYTYNYGLFGGLERYMTYAAEKYMNEVAGLEFFEEHFKFAKILIQNWVKINSEFLDAIITISNELSDLKDDLSVGDDLSGAYNTLINIVAWARGLNMTQNEIKKYQSLNKELSKELSNAGKGSDIRDILLMCDDDLNDLMDLMDKIQNITSRMNSVYGKDALDLRFN